MGQSSSCCIRDMGTYGVHGLPITWPQAEQTPSATAGPCRAAPPHSNTAKAGNTTHDVAVIIGAGGMGQAIARRIAPGSHLLVADHSQEVLDTAAGRLTDEGHQVTSQPVDVSSHASVSALARMAVSLGKVRSVVHTAGLSPVQAPVSAILAVDLLGVALVLEEFAATATGNLG